MIRLITGKLVTVEPQAVVVNVNGVGYLINTPIPPDSTKIGIDKTYHTYLAVRETALDLYGFETTDELSLFTALLKVPKIGPKSALQILTQADATLLIQAITEEDPEHLVKMSGMGKKTAENVVNGLKGKLPDLNITPASYNNDKTEDSSITRDAIDALIALGYPHNDAREVVKALNPLPDNAQEAVRQALKQLSN